MAPPSSRRPGFSRRAQYGLFIGYVVALAGVLFAVFLLIIAIIDPRGFAAIKGAALDATTPISTAGRSVVRFFGNAGDSVGNYINAGGQNARLREELEAARRELVAAQATELENRRLKAMLELAEGTGDEITVARIVGSSFDSPWRFATLNAGSSAGIEPGQPVRAPEGLIGRIVETGRWASRVLLVTDGSSNVPVRLVRDGTPALAVGRGDGTIELRTLEVGANPFRPGDILVTSGIGGLFPPQVPVARVVAIQGDTALARPLADPARADFALVQRVFQPAARGGLDDASPPSPDGAAPPPPGLAPAQRRSPDYQPALQRPQPGIRVQPAPPPQPEPEG